MQLLMDATTAAHIWLIAGSRIARAQPILQVVTNGHARAVLALSRAALAVPAPHPHRQGTCSARGPEGAALSARALGTVGFVIENGGVCYQDRILTYFVHVFHVCYFMNVFCAYFARIT